LHRLSYVPLIAPSTTDARIAFLATVADSFIYVVSRMGTTGSTTASNSVSDALPAQIARIKKFTSIPLAVGFGVATKDHFSYIAQTDAEGVVIGSKIIQLVGDVEGGVAERATALENYCREVSSGPSKKGESGDLKEVVKEQATTVPELAEVPSAEVKEGQDLEIVLPGRFGSFGGQYVPESLVDSLSQLEKAHKAALADPTVRAPPPSSQELRASARISCLR
jgi:tryptophan synthase